MKTLVTFLLLASVNLCFAQLRTKYEEATIIFTDGKSKKGLAETNMGPKTLSFKASKEAKPEEIDVENIKTIQYTEGNKVDYDRIKVYLGWKQERISEYAWYEVVERGIVTLYVKRTSMQGSIYNPQSKAYFADYFVIRAGEPAAKMIANVAGANSNQTFRAKGPLYFADWPELADKIKNKVYTWKDLTNVIKEYNTWAAAKK